MPTEPRTVAPMTDERAQELREGLATALDGTCLHEWAITASAASGGLIAENANGDRFAVQITTWRIP